MSWYRRDGHRPFWLHPDLFYLPPVAVVSVVADGTFSGALLLAVSIP